MIVPLTLTVPAVPPNTASFVGAAPLFHGWQQVALAHTEPDVFHVPVPPEPRPVGLQVRDCCAYADVAIPRKRTISSSR